MEMSLLMDGPLAPAGRADRAAASVQPVRYSKVRPDTNPRCTSSRGCRKPVGRFYGTKPQKRGFRLVDGVAWRWFCSVKCQGEDEGKQMPKNFVKAVAAHHQKARDRALRRLVAACKEHMTPDGLVPVKAFVKAWMVERRKEYTKGYSAGILRERDRWRHVA